MKQYIKYLSLAAIVVMGALIASCEKIDLRIDPVVEDNIVVCTTTLNRGTAGTKALTAGGEKTFAVGETMAVVYKNTSGNTVKAVSAALTDSDIETGNKSATFTFELTNPDKGQNVTYVYPAAMADADGSINYAALDSQDGSLATLSSNLDLATYTGAWKGTSLPTGTLDNPFAILAINLKYPDAEHDITSSVTGMTVSDGTNTYSVTRAAAAGPIYVAIRPTASANITITAAAGPTIYSKSLTSKTYAASNGYTVGWMMSRYGINLAAVTTNTTALNGDTITGALDTEHYPVKISIANNATVTLDGITINGVNNSSYTWAGLNCEGNATIILKDGTTNTVSGFNEFYPGIHVPKNNTLTIQGTGTLNASSRYGAGIGGGAGINCGNIQIESGTINVDSHIGTAAGIGGGRDASCGNITISGGLVTAIGGAAGIGSGYAYSGTTSCGNISITGGTIIATGGNSCAGIGSGCNADCGAITITSGITRVTATKGEDAINSIGKGWGNSASTCGTVTIDGIVFWQSNAYKNGGGDYLTRSTLVYPQVTDLSTITEEYTASFRETLTGTLGANVKISIADGHTVTLDNVTINGTNNNSYGWAGITCLGDATIILKDGSANIVKGFYKDYPGISVPAGKTLIIKGETAPGTGSLNASSNASSSDVYAGAGIGGHSTTPCGNIEIQGGNITATCTGKWGAGIGGGGHSSSVACGYITISGGTVTANGGGYAAGIGSGADGSCGAITITTGVTKVTAYRGTGSDNDCIGRGNGAGNTCASVTIGGVVYWDGSAYQNGGDTHIKQSALTYEPTH